jgi:hypothetical protein
MTRRIASPAFISSKALEERVRAVDTGTIQILYSGSVFKAAIDTHSPRRLLQCARTTTMAHAR